MVKRYKLFEDTKIPEDVEGILGEGFKMPYLLKKNMRDFTNMNKIASTILEVLDSVNVEEKTTFICYCENDDKAMPMFILSNILNSNNLTVIFEIRHEKLKTNKPVWFSIPVYSSLSAKDTTEKYTKRYNSFVNKITNTGKEDVNNS